MEIWREWLGTWSGYKQKYYQLVAENKLLRDEIKEASRLCDLLIGKLGGDPYAGFSLKQKLLNITKYIDEIYPIPAPIPPIITGIEIRDIDWVSAQMQEIADLGMEYYQLDSRYRLTNQKNWITVIAWDWTEKKEYLRNWWDCENYALMFWVHSNLYFRLNSVGFVFDYKSGHAYDLLLYADGKKAILETQLDTLYSITNRNRTHYSLEQGCFAI